VQYVVFFEGAINSRADRVTHTLATPLGLT